MPRIKGSGALGPVRSLRLPRAIDRWFEERLRDNPARPGSDLLLVLIHGGLRLRSGYMENHQTEVAELLASGDDSALQAYLRALRDTFNDAYMQHLENWIASEIAKRSGGARALECVKGVL
ncbi:MAG: hypothetical protein M3R51_06920 [Candidatus Eremiobacteraeota bacterium]|nr:hypothetical protein [Candidatus Eremiobacteraeota bacterium]